jgi:hypothetical protein
MRIRFFPVTASALAIGLGMLGGCKQDAAAPAGEPTAMTSEPAVMPTGQPTADATGGASGIASQLDLSALDERQEPEKLLRFYVNALRVGAWDVAASAWTLDAQMTGQKLERQYGGDAGPKLAVGKGDVEAAAGRMFYEAPIVVDFPDGRQSLRGTIVLTRINNMAGASEQQLKWRIERSSTVVE